jgi:hypothetical protein
MTSRAEDAWDSRVESFFKNWVSADLQIERYNKLSPNHKEIVDFLISYDVSCSITLSYKEPVIHILCLIGQREWFYFFTSLTVARDEEHGKTVENLHKVIVDPLELNLTDPRPWARLIGSYKANLLTKQDSQILETLKYLNRKYHGDPPPWKTNNSQ